jgi:hypothetical protein
MQRCSGASHSSERNTILCALGVGIGHDPMDRNALRYVHEIALQAMRVVLGTPASGPRARPPRKLLLEIWPTTILY